MVFGVSKICPSFLRPIGKPTVKRHKAATCCIMHVDAGGMTLQQWSGLSAGSYTTSWLLRIVIIISGIGSTQESPRLRSKAKLTCGIGCVATFQL